MEQDGMVGEAVSGVKRARRLRARAAPADCAGAAAQAAPSRDKMTASDTVAPDLGGIPLAPAALPSTATVDSDTLLAWYDRHRRHLPWRALPGEAPNTYRVWLSEIMLQQTTVRAVIPYFERFLARWPTVQSLAEDREEVLRAWVGLGYYSRARNLHACAVEVTTRYAGVFPDTEAGLRTLPGVGAYTAAAIAAIAFGRRAAVVDGNIERVMARVDAVETPLPAAKVVIRKLVEAVTPVDRPGDFAQAMMDLGATICTPRRPACALCPWMQPCRARAAGSQETFPRKAEKAARRLRRGLAFWISRPDGTVLVRTRPDQGLFGGMTEIPSSSWVESWDGQAALLEAPLPAPLGGWQPVPGVARHGLTHFELELSLVRGEVPAGTAAPDRCRWVGLDQLGNEALPTAMRRVVALVLM